MQQQMQTVRTLEAEREKVVHGIVSTGAKEYESTTGRVWAAEFHHVTTNSRLAGILKHTNHLFFLIFQFCFGPRQTADTCL
jgi:hypothetical protein